MGAEHDRRAPAFGDVAHRASTALAGRVETEGGLVEEDDRRVVHQGPGDAQPLPHPPAVGRDEGAGDLLESDLGEQGAALRRPPPGRAVEAGVEAQVLCTGRPAG